MCGIAGFLTARKSLPADESNVRAMVAALRHRGPDDVGAWVDHAAGVAFGHRRLSVIDLSAAGRQPMHSKCGRYTIVFNGEIYNFMDLRRELTAKGCQFVGGSDTEVLLEGLAAWGVESALKRCNGCFALALWDRVERRLFLARDRLGEKPLYYGWHDGTFLFASELKAFHAHRGFAPEMDRAVLALYLRHGYVPEPYCIYKDLRKLVPGTFVSISAQAPGRMPAPQAYWSLAAAVANARRNPLDCSAEEGIDALDDALKRSVQMRMVADVPLGAFLSGGLDSSAVVALMNSKGDHAVRSFSVGFEEAGYDEAPQAAAIARHLGTEHTEFYVTSAEARSVIPRLAEIYDEPFADASQLPTCLIAELARRYVTVVMSGDGGDELFGGYSRYAKMASMWRKLQHTPPKLRSMAASAMTAISARCWNRMFAAASCILPARLHHSHWGDRLHKIAELLDLDDPMQMYFRLISLWPQPESIVLGTHEPETTLVEPTLAHTMTKVLDRMMFFDTMHYLPGDILTKVDRASMAVGLEARVPFLDHNLIELAWRMPHEWKIRGNQGKWILRRLLGRYMPAALFDRPKMGFKPPIDQWLRGPLRDWAEHLLDATRLKEAGIFRPEPIRAAWRAHTAGARDLRYEIWAVLMFEAWRERWAYHGVPR